MLDACVSGITFGNEIFGSARDSGKITLRNGISALLLFGIAAASGGLAQGRGWAHASGIAPARVAPHRYAIVVGAPSGRTCIHDLEKRFMAIPGVDAVDIDTGTMTITVTMRPGASLEPAAAANAVGEVGLVMREFHFLTQGPHR